MSGTSPYALWGAGGVPRGWLGSIREEMGALGACRGAAGSDTAVLSRPAADMEPVCRTHWATWRTSGVTARVGAAQGASGGGLIGGGWLRSPVRRATVYPASTGDQVE